MPLFAVILLLGACGGDGGDEPGPTTAPGPSPTGIVELTATQVQSEISGSTATDGLCQVTIPDNWVDDGTGRGITAQGSRWSLFGGSIDSDAAWNSARDLLKGQFSGRDGVELTEDDTRVTIVLPNGRGYVVRERFEGLYCELAIMSTLDQPAEVTAIWAGVGETLDTSGAPDSAVRILT